MENSDRGFVIYSLGNFVSGQVKEGTKDSIILNLTVTKKSTGEVVVDTAEYTPIYTYRGSGGVKQYKVLDIQKSINSYEQGASSLSQADYQTLLSEYNKITERMGK